MINKTPGKRLILSNDSVVHRCYNFTQVSAVVALVVGRKGKFEFVQNGYKLFLYVDLKLGGES